MVKLLRGYAYDTIPEEDPVLNHPVFRRQRAIKQLGQIEAIHSGATQTRYDHGQMAAHIAASIYDVLAQQGRQVPVARQDSVYQSLLHDIGHMCFSHLTEYLIASYTGIDHKENALRILGSQRRDGAGRTIQDALESVGADPQILMGMLKREPRFRDAVTLCSHKALGADKLAYTLQDADRVQFDQMPPSWEKVVKLITCYSDGMGINLDAHDGRFNDPIGVVEAMQNFYQRMYTEVYLHPVSLSLERSIQRSLEHAINGGVFKAEEVLDFHDEQLIDSINRAAASNPDVKQAHKHIDSYVERRPWESVLAFKLDTRSKLRNERAVMIGDEFVNRFLERFRDPRQLTRLEDRLTDRLGQEVLVSVLPDPEKVYPVDIPIYAGGRRISMLQEMDPSHYDRLNSQATRTFAIRVLVPPEHHEHMHQQSERIAEEFSVAAETLMDQCELLLKG